MSLRTCAYSNGDCDEHCAAWIKETEWIDQVFNVHLMEIISCGRGKFEIFRETIKTFKLKGPID